MTLHTHHRTRGGIRPALIAAATLAATLTVALGVPPMTADAATSTTIVAENASYQSRRTGGAALYDNVSNTTYVAWNGPQMDIYIRGYSHASNSWSAPVKVADWDDSSTYAYHDYTVLRLLPNGRLAIFVADHTTSATLFTAPTANSMSGTWSRKVISTDRVTYPEPVIVNGTVYLFYSRNDDLSWPYRSYRMISSSDNGQTWSAASTVIDTGRSADRFSEVYVLSADSLNGRPCFTWTLAGGTGHNEQARDLYSACWNPGDRTMRSLGNANLGATIDEAEHTITRIVAAPTSAAAKRPIDQAALTRDPTTGRYLVGVSFTRDGVGRLDAGTVAEDGSVTWTRVETGTTRFSDIVWNGQGAEILSLNGDATRIRTHQVKGGTVVPLSDNAVPYGATGADAVWTANFVDYRKTISYVGYSVDVSERTSNYSGAWRVFAGVR